MCECVCVGGGGGGGGLNQREELTKEIRIFTPSQLSDNFIVLKQLPLAKLMFRFSSDDDIEDFHKYCLRIFHFSSTD